MMISKKYTLLLLSLTIMVTGAIAQTYSVWDSTVIGSRAMPQQTEFWNNTYSFPAKPRNMWEIGVAGGIPTISGDVQSKLPTFGFSAHVRKALGYIFSLRLQYFQGTAKGISWLGSENFGKNSAWKDYYAPYRTPAGPIVSQNGSGVRSATNDIVFYNYKTSLQDLSLQGIFTTNNIRFHKAKTGFVIYGGAGIGASLYKPMVNSHDANGRTYQTQFNDIFAKYQTGVYKNRKDVLKALKDAMDDTYETQGERQGTDGNRRPLIGDKTMKPSGTVIVGTAFRLGRRINLALENRHTFVKDDLLDGQRWQEHARGDAVLTRDFDSYNFFSVGLNFNLGAKAVEPLYWLNPLTYVYDELNNPRHMKLPKMTCDDTDGDGVCDFLDREPNTPAGCPVDTHGVTLDTDGDGVPDCKDKQLITPTECQPVDADGVGKCPDHCCDKVDTVKACPSAYPSVVMKGITLSGDNKAMLASVATTLKNNPTCNISIVGYPEATKASQAQCQKRVDAIKAYLVEQGGISADRISTDCSLVGGGEKNTVDIKAH